MNVYISFVLFVAIAACVSAAPKPSGLLAVAAPAPIVTATSSQVIARNYNGFAAPYVAAPVAAAPYVAAPVAAAPYVASPYVASPYVASPYVASPYVASPYVASPYAAYAPYSPYTAAYTSAVVV